MMHHDTSVWRQSISETEALPTPPTTAANYSVIEGTGGSADGSVDGSNSGVGVGPATQGASPAVKQKRRLSWFRKFTH